MGERWAVRRTDTYASCHIRMAFHVGIDELSVQAVSWTFVRHGDRVDVIVEGEGGGEGALSDDDRSRRCGENRVNARQLNEGKEKRTTT